MNPTIAPSPASACEGKRRRDAAHRLLIAHRAPYILAGGRAQLQASLANDEGTGTADDIHDRVTLPKTINPKCFGAVPRMLKRAGLIVSVGMTPSRRTETHARKIEVWKLIDRDAALAWLSAHPAPTLPIIVETDSSSRTQLDLFTDSAPIGANDEGSATR